MSIDFCCQLPHRENFRICGSGSHVTRLQPHRGPELPAATKSMGVNLRGDQRARVCFADDVLTPHALVPELGL